MSDFNPETPVAVGTPVATVATNARDVRDTGTAAGSVAAGDPPSAGDPTRDVVAPSPDVAPRRPVAWVVNGVAVTIAVAPHASLLHVLRNALALNGPKYGCGLGQCGACLVFVDGRPARACVVPATGVDGREIVTLEGLGTRADPHPVQRAFIDAQAAQCGYCLNGMIVATVALLAAAPDPTDAQIRAALSHNLCRCGTHVEIVAAVRLAARRLADAGPPPTR